MKKSEQKISPRKSAKFVWQDENGRLYMEDPQIIMVPLWIAIIVTIGLCAMSASLAYSVRPAPKLVTHVLKVDHPGLHANRARR